jgi:hypothetical protein
MLQFVPLTDDVLYAAGGPPALLVPYRCGLACSRAQPVPSARDDADANECRREALSGSRSEHRPD